IINGIDYRFIDTAATRDTKDVVESIGIQKTFEKIEQAQVILYLFESLKFKAQGSEHIIEIQKIRNKYPQKPLVVIINKVDLLSEQELNVIKAEIGRAHV